MPSWPGEPGPQITPVKRFAAGDGANVSRMTLGLHTGTHIDAPWHFIDGGATAEALPLDVLCGAARVVDIVDDRAVRVAELERAGLEGVTRVLFRTRNGRLWDDDRFHEDYVFVAPEAAEWLVARGVRLVGVDYLSVEEFTAATPRAHLILLGAGVVIVEGLDLRASPAGDYEMFCLPLRIVGGDGAPARVVLISGGPPR
jgi:arylformamidase